MPDWPKRAFCHGLQKITVRSAVDWRFFVEASGTRGVAHSWRPIFASERSSYPALAYQPHPPENSRVKQTSSTIVFFLALTLACPAANAKAVRSAFEYRNPNMNAEQRAVDLVSHMTLEEKVGQLRNAAPAISRLGIGAYDWWNEGLHGVARAGTATVFPQAVGMAATFDVPLVGTIADVIATEFRAKYRERAGKDGGSAKYRGLTVWSPNVNIFRDPRWGRGQETYGEDPYLTAKMGVAFIRGLQGDDPNYFKTIATVKHFAVHSGPEADRHREDVHPSAHDLVDTYLPAFHAAVVEANVQGVMCSYNSVDGVPACANQSLLHDLLRSQWGFKGHVVSDCGAVADFFEADAHHFSASPQEAVASSLKAGTDLICGAFDAKNGVDPQVFLDAVKAGLLRKADIDVALRRLFEARIRLGLLNPSSRAPYSKIRPSANDTPEHRALARRAAEASIVLLKNTGVLPLKTTPSRIAVVGPNADNIDALVGNYSGTPSKPITVLAGLHARFPSAEITYVEGSGLVGPPVEPIPDSALCADSGCATSGLAVEEFAGPDLSAPQVQTYSVKNASFAWGRPQRQERNSSMRWHGVIVPQESGSYNFGFVGSARYRIFIDGKLTIDTWKNSDLQASGAVALNARQPYSLVVEAVQKGAHGDQHLVWSRPATNAASAVKAADRADLIVFVGGLTAKLEGEQMNVSAPGFSQGDRTSLDLPATQENLLKRLHGTGKPIVLVLMNGSALSVNWENDQIPAIVEAWYPGEEGGSAVASLLAGDYSPSGRLPVTFYKSASDLPPFKDYAMSGRTYRYFRGPVLYPFGYGLSFTRFSYGNIAVSDRTVQAGKSVVVSAVVRNTGPRDGDEVVQLYLSSSRPGAPIRSLAGVQRISLKSGEAREVHFTVDAKTMSTVTSEGKRTIEAGIIDIWIGGGQPGSRPDSAEIEGVASTLNISGRADLANY